MRTLAIETATEACSVALFEDGALIARDHRVLGRGHAEALVPMIAALPGKGQARRILVSRGPGSFTGVRIGIATARALGFAWKAEVLGYPTLALVAAIAREEAQSARGSAPAPVRVAMAGGHGEWFVQDFGPDARPENAAQSLPPDEAASLSARSVLAGNRARELAEHVGDDTAQVLDILPDAARTLLLAGALQTADLAPIYGRGPDAVPMAQRGSK
ncbi:tRNA (adenosine(37)-N6)-threonylcarbamoyltransferase complex dimerization subunit type 1 TsaB [Qipengyuania nanhaisediminis]|uniref:tRNA (adenosine(37)-N6)-threonylcarbamoyltransferase complex dimerization subunit type 1 TsaB n=1 Tax=Qipengyuania nanhaisediminis TaxID=604088 RepID=UPI0038B2A3FB